MTVSSFLKLNDNIKSSLIGHNEFISKSFSSIKFIIKDFKDGLDLKKITVLKDEFSIEEFELMNGSKIIIDKEQSAESLEYLQNKDKAIKKAIKKESNSLKDIGGVVGIPALGDMIRKK